MKGYRINVLSPPAAKARKTLCERFVVIAESAQEAMRIVAESEVLDQSRLEFAFEFDALTAERIGSTMTLARSYRTARSVRGYAKYRAEREG